MWATPVPRANDLDDLNAHLRACSAAARDRTCGDNTVPVGVRFEQDRAAGLAVPDRTFDACVTQPGQVDKYQTVRFDDNRYSVPRRWAFRSVTVKGYVDRVAIIADGVAIATHPRTYGRQESVLDPLHFLTVLGTKPAALDHAPVYRDWQLPAAIAGLRPRLEATLGVRAGGRQYIRVLPVARPPPPGSGRPGRGPPRGPGRRRHGRGRRRASGPDHRPADPAERHRDVTRGSGPRPVPVRPVAVPIPARR